MWFSGGSGLQVGHNQGIGYATWPCPTVVEKEVTAPPPENFVGKVLRNKFLNKNEYVLEMHWKPAAYADVKSYRLYHHGKPIADIAADEPLIYRRCLCSKKNTQGYTLVAIYPKHFKSQHVKLKILH